MFDLSRLFLAVTDPFFCSFLVTHYGAEVKSSEDKVFPCSNPLRTGKAVLKYEYVPVRTLLYT
jgi:hypothetical protein